MTGRKIDSISAHHPNHKDLLMEKPVKAGGFARATSMLMGAGIFAQAIQLLGTVFLARIYSPEAYGNLTLVVNLAAILAVLFSLQLHIALHISNSDEEAIRIQSAALVMIFTSSTFMACLALILRSETLFFATLAAAAVSGANLGRSNLARKSHNKLISALLIMRGGTVLVSQYSMKSLSSYGLVIGLIIGETITATAFLWSSVRKGFVRVRIPKVILEYKNFTAWGVIQELASTAVVFTPSYLCSYLYGDEILGHYGIAYRLLWAPVVVISFGFGLVFLTELSRAPNQFAQILAALHYKKIVVLICICALSGFLWLPPIFHLILGDKWDLAASMSPAIALSCATFLISSPYRQLYRVREQQIKQLKVELITLLLLGMTTFLPEMLPLYWAFMISAIIILQNVLMIAIIRRFQYKHPPQGTAR